MICGGRRCQSREHRRTRNIGTSAGCGRFKKSACARGKCSVQRVEACCMTCEINQRPDTASHRALHVSVTYVFLEHCALLAIVRIGHARIAAYDAAPLVAPVVALVADPYERCRAHVRVANDTLSVACGGFIGFCFCCVRSIMIQLCTHTTRVRPGIRQYRSSIEGAGAGGPARGERAHPGGRRAR